MIYIRKKLQHEISATQKKVEHEKSTQKVQHQNNTT